MASLWCSRTLRRIISDLSSCHDIRLLSGCQAQLELVFREVVATEVLFDNDVNITAAFNFVREALSIVQNEIEQLEGRPQRYQVPTVTDVTLGRPRFSIPRHQLAFMLEAQFSVPIILGVSIRTVRRRMSDYNLTVRMFYANISDEELDRIVAEIQQQFPTCGNRQMQGHLLSRGISVESQRRVDLAGSIMRRLRIIHRRRYHVNGPQALWHIDKLIRYL